MSNPPGTLEPTVVLPDGGNDRPPAPVVAALPGRRPRLWSPADPASRDPAPWLVPLVAVMALVAIALLVIAALGLTRSDSDDRSSAVGPTAIPPDVVDVTPAAPNATLAIGTAAAFTSTIRVGEDEDLLGAIAVDPTAASTHEGSPVTGDAVVVQQVLGSDAFSVASAEGGVPLVVYLPGATDELRGFVPGSTEVLFTGTLHRVPVDVGVFLGYEPASIAARTGVYVIAVPETVIQVDPPSA